VATNKQKHFMIKNSAISAFMIVSFFMQSSLFAQAKSNTMSGRSNMIDSLHGITIHQEVEFNVNPAKLYEALLGSKQFSECTSKSGGGFSAASAKIDNTVGGEFAVFDGHIIGRILELVPNQRIVEAWRVADWPAGEYSIAKFELRAKGSGTQLIFDHKGFPENLKEHLALGWQQHYWDALSKYFQ
jgi:activator of HSP90 ATPase